MATRLSARVALATSVLITPGCIGDGTARSRYEEITGNPIPAQFGQEIVWLAPEQPAGLALLAVDMNAKTAADCVRALLQEHWGLAIDNAPTPAEHHTTLRSKPYNLSDTTSFQPSGGNQ